MVTAVAQRGLSGRISRVLPFAGVLVGWKHRNRVYRSAEDFIRDRNLYYDALRDTARQQLVQRQQLGLRTSQVAAYARVVALIEQQRKTELDVAEARKREARTEFHARVEDAVLYALAGNRVVQQVIDSMRTGVGSAQQALDRVLNKITSGSTGVLGDIQRVRKIAGQLSDVAGMIGGDAGRKLGAISDRIAATIDQSQAAARDLVQQIQGELRSLDDSLRILREVGRTPTAGDVIEHLLARLPGNGSSENIPAGAVATILSKLEVGDGSLKDEARKAINAGFVARCNEFSKELKEKLEALKNSGKSDDSDVPPGPVCRAVQPGDLQQGADQTLAEEPTEEPPTLAPEVLPIVTATGSYSESVSGGAGPSPGMGSSFTLTANFAAGTITFSLSGGRTVSGFREACVDAEDPSIEVDWLVVDYIEAYTAQASGALDPETGEFSVPFTPRGATTDRKTALFTDPGCVHLNSGPAPGSHAYASTEGLISGYVTRDGAIEFSTSWSHCGTAHMKGGWSGYGSVSAP
jgi:hypothetical protein